MMREIRDQKQGGNAACSEHACPMLRYLMPLNEVEPANEENAARSVQYGIQMRKPGN
jgi:hypothetical protein